MRGSVAVIGILVLAGVVGCAGRKSSLLLERQARGPLNEEPLVATAVRWVLSPLLQTDSKGGIDVQVNHASVEYLKNFFNNPEIFGAYAGKSPYYPEYLVFYIKITNHSPSKIRFNPAEFVLVDDRGNQYATVGVDYVTAFAEYRTPVGTSTRGVVEGASPGYFGVSVPIGKLIARKPQSQFALLQQSSLQPGYLYPDVVHDGLIAFWNPSINATKVTLLITNIKTSFDANDWPKSAIDFAFEFQAAKAAAQQAEK